jgi:hypothetical protein
MRLASKVGVALALLAGVGGSKPAQAELLLYHCIPVIEATTGIPFWEFEDIFVGTEQQRLVFPRAGAGSDIGRILARPDAVRTVSRVSTKEISFEFWSYDHSLHGHMIITQSDGRFKYTQESGKTRDDILASCKKVRLPPRDRWSKLHISDLN